MDLDDVAGARMFDRIGQRFAHGESELIQFGMGDAIGECKRNDFVARAFSKLRPGRYAHAEAHLAGPASSGRGLLLCHLRYSWNVTGCGVRQTSGKDASGQAGVPSPTNLRPMSAQRCPVVYVLACRDGSFYAGWTLELRKRLEAHARGAGAKYVRSRLPFALAAWWPAADATAARRLETVFKALSRAGKLEVLSGRRGIGAGMRKAPLFFEPPTAERRAMSHTPPTGNELATLVDEARQSQARIRTVKGDIVFAFYPGDAPQHCAAFIKLANAGFYDGLTFHRVEPGFVIQGGDPQGDGTGGPGYQLDAEFSNQPHVRGTVAMARSANPNSAGSQFYMCLADARFLDKQYTVFGQTREGLDVLDQIRRGDAIESVRIEPLAAQGDL